MENESTNRSHSKDKKFSKNCNECPEILKEDAIIKAYRQVFKNDMRDVLKEELGTRDEMFTKVDNMHIQSWPLTIFNRKIYLAQFGGILFFFFMVFMLIKQAFSLISKFI